MDAPSPISPYRPLGHAFTRPVCTIMQQVFDDFVEIAVAANQNMSTDFRHQTICTIELTGTLLLLLADGS